MKRAALLQFTINDLGIYSLHPYDGTELDCKPLEETERMTISALCRAVNEGLTDDAVYEALRADLEALEAREAAAPCASRG